MTTPSERTAELVEEMKQCAHDTDTPFAELTWAIYKGWNDVDLEARQRAFAARGGFQKVRDAHAGVEPTQNLREKAALTEKANKNRRGQRQQIAYEASADLLNNVLEKTFAKGLPPVKPFAPPKAQVGKGKPAIANIFLSDLHFGSDLKSTEGFMQYGYVEEARCLASIVKRVCEYKPSHRAYTDLNVYLGGDLIRGKIHDREFCLPMALQTGDALWLLLQAIEVWAAHYKKVTVHCVSGNHDRSPDVHKGVAVTGRFDSEATKIYYGLKLALRNQENVEVVVPMTQYHSLEVFGERVYLGHGDINLNPGYPGSTINVRSLERQINNLNVGAASRGEKPFRLFLVGHVHVGSLVHLPMGDLITNGTTQPSDSFGGSIGYYTSARGQVMFESVPGHIVGDYRFLSVDENVHKDASLDKIIRPFSGKF